MQIPLPPVEFDRPEVEQSPTIFNSLEDRYNKTVTQIYAAAKYKFDGGRASLGFNDDPLIVRKPNNGYWNFAESRSLPIASTINDLKRLTLFTTSPRGIAFVLKQQVLQTGNTFESTRIINPVFHIANAVPFTHTKRMIDIPITGRGLARALLGNNAITKRIFGSGEQGRDIASLRKIAQLQQETFNKSAGKKDLMGGILKKIPVIGQTISAVKAKRSMGEVDDGWTNTRPELNKSDVLGGLGGIVSRLPGAFGLLGQLARATDTGYIVYKDRTNKTKFQQKQTTIFDPKYGPNILGLYDTYLEATSDKKKSWYLGQTQNIYTTLRRLNIRVGVNNQQRLDIINNKIAISSAANASSIEQLYFNRTTGKSSLDRFAFLTNKRLVSYIDYGSAVRYTRQPSRPDTPLTKPKLNNASTAALRTLENYSYPSSSEKPITKDRSEKYFSDVARLENPDQATAGFTGVTTVSTVNRSYIKYFNSGKGSIRSSGFKEAFNDNTTNAKVLAEVNRSIDENLVNISYLRDPLNSPTVENDEFNPETLALKPYKNLRSVNHMVGGEPPGSYIDTELGDVVDPIVVSFAMGRDDHIQFRAFIRDLQQTATPQYKDYQYIGRIEKFISYVTVQREISFKLDIVAFSKDELDIVWKRINYITGLVFPYGINKGILQPNIVRLTIGQIYTDQPGYITSLDTSFSELSPSWDIDKQVPINATMNIRFKLIEKNVALADSPLYGINEGNSDFDRITQDETIPA